MPLGASKPSLSCYLGLIKTIEGEHAEYLTQTVYRTKLLLLGERNATPGLPVCPCPEGILRCIYMSAAGWVGSQVEFWRPI